MVNEIKEEVNFQCSICEREIPSFSDKMSAWEYEVIGLCQECLGRIFTVVYSPSEEV